MILKKLISSLSALAILISSFTLLIPSASAAEELLTVFCTQSASYINSDDETSFVLNTADKETHDKIYWNASSGDWKDVGILEFILPATAAYKIKSAELTYTVNNNADRSGARTYNIYAADVIIDDTLTAETLKGITLGDSIYTGEGLAQGATRVDTATNTAILNYVKSTVNAEAESKIQFALSNSSQSLNIDPATAELKLVVFDGGIALDKNELTLLSNGESEELTVGIYSEGITSDDFVWTSENSEVASVDNGCIIMAIFRWLTDRQVIRRCL